MAEDEPASPPLPEKHVAATPGPRATRLRDLYAQALEHTLGKLAWDNFAACYPTVAGRAEGVLRQVQGQMVGKLGEKCEVKQSPPPKAKPGERERPADKDGRATEGI